MLPTPIPPHQFLKKRAIESCCSATGKLVAQFKQSRKATPGNKEFDYGVENPHFSFQ